MSISKEDEYICFDCDKCSATYETESSYFDESWDYAQQDGWRRKFNDKTNQWEHFCEDCFD